MHNRGCGDTTHAYYSFGIRKKNFRDPEQKTIKTLSHATNCILSSHETNSATICAILLHCVASEVNSLD
jgi:hypothetical protein